MWIATSGCKAGEQGLLCPTVPEEFGGAGTDFLYNVVIDEEIARLGLSGIGWGLHSDIVAPYIVNYGSPKLKEKYLPRMISGEMISAIAMTEPGAGSDLQGVKTSAVPTATITSSTARKRSSPTGISRTW